MDIRFLIENSGPLLWPLIGLSIVVAAAAIERSIFLRGLVRGPCCDRSSNEPVFRVDLG